MNPFDKIEESTFNAQLSKVLALMLDGNWRTLEQIERATGASQASASARLRDFRKAKFGGHTVNRRRAAGAWAGRYEYQLVLNQSQVAA